MYSSHHHAPHIGRGGFDIPSEPKQAQPFTTIEAYLETIAKRYETVVMVIRGGLTTREWLAQEYERQMSMLVNFVEEGAQS